MKEETKMNRIARAVYEARKNKSTISANIRLKKNGQFSSVSGIVEELTVSRDGFAYLTVKKGKDEYQSVRLDNILCLSKDNKIYRR